MQSTPESGARAGCDGAKKKNGSKVHQSVTLAYVDQGYTGDAPAEAAKKAGITLAIVKLPEAKKGFMLLPCCCRVAGWWSAVLRGRHASIGLPKTMSAFLRHCLRHCLRHWRRCISPFLPF